MSAELRFRTCLHAAYTPGTRQNNAGHAGISFRTRSARAHSQHVRWTCVRSTLVLR